MPCTFFGIELARRALVAHTIAAQVCGHNLANAATEGYSRQRAVLVPSDPWAYPSLQSETGAGQLGTGVDIALIKRVQDQYLTARLRGSASAHSYLEAWSGGLSETEALICEPSEQGLGAQLSAFWNAWHELSLNPDDSAARMSVREAGRALAELFHSLTNSVSTQTQAVDEQVGCCGEEINRLAHEIARLTHGIRASLAVGAQPNDLMDQRDQALLELSRIAEVRVAEATDGGLVLTLGGRTLVQDETVIPLRWSVHDGVICLQWSDDSSAVGVSGGRLGALLAIRDDLLPWVQGQLDETAARLVNAVNEVHREGYGLDGVSNRDFFVGSTAADIALSEPVLNSLSAIAAGMSPEPGDGGNAARIGELRNEQSLGPDSHYRDMVTAIGVRVGAATQEHKTQQLLADHLLVLREQIAGVSTDEEVIALMRYQQGYNAAARLLTVMDEMLERLILHTGLVGR